MLIDGQEHRTYYRICKRGRFFAIYKMYARISDGAEHGESTGLEFFEYNDAKEALKKLKTGLYIIHAGELFKQN